MAIAKAVCNDKPNAGAKLMFITPPVDERKLLLGMRIAFVATVVIAALACLMVTW